MRSFIVVLVLLGLMVPSLGQDKRSDVLAELIEKISLLKASDSHYEARRVESDDCSLFFQIVYEDGSFESTTFRFEDLDEQSYRIEEGTYEKEWRFIILSQKINESERESAIQKNDNGRSKSSISVILYAYDQKMLEEIAELFLKVKAGCG